MLRPTCPQRKTDIRVAVVHFDKDGALAGEPLVGRCPTFLIALILGIVSLIAGALGFTGIAGSAAGIAKFLFFLCLAVVAALLILGFFVGKRVTGD